MIDLAHVVWMIGFTGWCYVDVEFQDWMQSSKW
jgi:hypothetical protein